MSRELDCYGTIRAFVTCALRCRDGHAAAPQMAIIPYLDLRLLISLSSVMRILDSGRSQRMPDGNTRTIDVHPVIILLGYSNSLIFANLSSKKLREARLRSIC